MFFVVVDTLWFVGNVGLLTTLVYEVAIALQRTARIESAILDAMAKSTQSALEASHAATVASQAIVDIRLLLPTVHLESVHVVTEDKDQL